jgi:hypothetical protein
MALSKTTTTQHGFEAINAYHRVESVSISGKTKIGFWLKSYKNIESTPFAEKAMVAPYDLEKSNPIKQAYEHLKTLPEFAGAIDC